jgi:subtilase family serine protease
MDDGIPIADKQENDGTKRRIKINPLLASYLFFVALMTVIVFYNPYSGGCPVVTVGFVNINPIISGIYYRGSNLTAMFSNSLGEAIRLDEVTLNETISGVQCNLVMSSPPLLSSVKAGETFTVTGVCPQKVDGEAYDLIVKINYSTSLAGITANHTDAGHIKGQGEAY